MSTLNDSERGVCRLMIDSASARWAGDHYSTVGDLLKLATAITSYRLLDSAHTAALLGQRYATGSDFRANGGGPGVNAEFSIFPNGDVLIVLANYDPPSATSVAQVIRGLVQMADKSDY
jgi:hypothetical protein